MVSCGGYNQLVKGRDYQAKYEGAMRYYYENNNNRAITLFNQIASVYEGSDKADTIRFFLAKAMYNNYEYEECAVLFDNFRKSYGRSPFLEEAEFLYAMSHYNVAPKYELDQTPTNTAISSLSEYKSRYPRGPRTDTVNYMLEDLRRRLHNKSFQLGETYYNVTYYNSAITTFNNTLREYPAHPRREDILFLIVKSHYLFARGSVVDKQRERYINTVDAALNFITEYPNSKYFKEVLSIKENADKLSKNRELLENADKSLRLTEKEIIKISRYAEKKRKRVEKGKLLPEEAEKLISDKSKKIEKRAQRRYERIKRNYTMVESFEEKNPSQEEVAERAKEEQAQGRGKK